jgi:hypothetical protein
MPNYIETNARELNSCVLEFTLEERPGVAIPQSAITEATFWLYNQADSSIINDQEDIDIRDNFDANGKFVMTLSAADNVIVDENDLMEYETHVARIKVVANNGADDIEYEQEFWIRITNEKFIVSTPPIP